MRLTDLARPMVLAAVVAIGGTSAAWAQSNPGGARPSLAELLWLRDMLASTVDPAYRAVDTCERLLGNAVSAWQLTPQNVRDCQAGRSEKSPIDAINVAASSCWGTISGIIVELNAAYTEFRLADQLRTRPESKPHFDAGNAHASTASGMLPGLKDCVKRVVAQRDAAVNRLTGEVRATQPTSGELPGPARGSTSVPPGSVVLWTRRYAGRWPNGVPNQPPPGIPVKKAWTPTREMQGELLSGRCQLYQGTADDFIACPGWEHGVRHSDLVADTAFICRNPSPPPFCSPQPTAGPPLTGRVLQDPALPPTPTDPNVLPVINDGRNFSTGLADGAKECVAQFEAIAAAVAQLAQSGKWGELDQMLGIRRQGLGPVVKRWIDDIAFDALHSLQEPQDLPAQLSAQQASQRDFQRGRLAGLRLCTFGIAGGAAKLAGHAVGQVGGPLVARVADAARKTASPQVRLAGSVAEAVISDVSARTDRTITATQQTQLVAAIAEIGRVEASSLGNSEISQALSAHRAIVDETLRKLAGDTIYLPGTLRGQVTKVTLGAPLGKGSFGWVFPIVENGQPTANVIKILGNNLSYLANGVKLPAGTPALVDNVGGDSLLAQAKGSAILQRLGIPTPKIGYMHPAQKAGEFSFAIMERIDTDAPNIDVWSGTRFGQAVKRAAIVDLHQRLAAAGYIAADLAPRNVYFTLQNGIVRAGVWDSDLIISVPIKADAATLARFRGVLEGAAMGNNSTRTNSLNLLFDIDYTDAGQAMGIIQKIQWGNLQ